MTGFTTVFLDRDGTINLKAAEGAYIQEAADLRLLPGAGDALHLLNRAGLRTILVTNQRGIARGLVSEQAHSAVMSELDRLLALHGSWFDRIYICPHDIGVCRCRKPAPGLIEQAMHDDAQIEPKRSVIVGDSESDVEAGQRAGLTTVRLGQPHTVTSADRLFPTLPAAVDWILDHSGRNER